MELRGLRYEPTPELKDFVENGLAFLDYKQTRAWYRGVVRHITRKNDLAFLGCNDRYFLFTGLLGRTEAFHPWLFDRCREVEASPDDHLDLWARGHYKSSIITFAGAIQEIVCDPEITIAIFANVKPIAHAFLQQIMQELERNELLKETYGDVFYQNPRKEAPLWSVAGGIVCKRATNPKEATVEAHGLIDGQPISRHYSLRIYDDVVTDRSVTTPEIVRKTTEKWELSDNLRSARSSRRWHTGTRYAFGDTYGIILEEKRGLTARVYPATDDGTLSGEPVFLSKKEWDKVKQTQRRTVAAQMLLNPIAGNEAIFQAEWFRPYELIPTILNVYVMCDPSKGATARSDRTAIAVIGIDVAGNKYLLDGVRHRMRLSERWNWLKRFYTKWSAHPGVQIVRVGYERYGAQVDLEVIEEWQRRDGVIFPIEELAFPRQGQHTKTDRIERLEPDMRNGVFFLSAAVYHPDVVGRVATWRVWSEDDRKKAEERKETNNHSIGAVIYRPQSGLTRIQREVNPVQRAVAIRRLDENKNVYDVTRAFMEELRFFPFAPHDDLIDAASRLYDMEPVRPVVHEQLDELPDDMDVMVPVEN